MLPSLFKLCHCQRCAWWCMVRPYVHCFAHSSACFTIKTVSDSIIVRCPLFIFLFVALLWIRWAQSFSNQSLPFDEKSCPSRDQLCGKIWKVGWNWCENWPCHSLDDLIKFIIKLQIFKSNQSKLIIDSKVYSFNQFICQWILNHCWLSMNAIPIVREFWNREILCYCCRWLLWVIGTFKTKLCPICAPHMSCFLF